MRCASAAPRRRRHRLNIKADPPQHRPPPTHLACSLSAACLQLALPAACSTRSRRLHVLRCSTLACAALGGLNPGLVGNACSFHSSVNLGRPWWLR